MDIFYFWAICLDADICSTLIVMITSLRRSRKRQVVENHLLHLIDVPRINCFGKLNARGSRITYHCAIDTVLMIRGILN